MTLPSIPLARCSQCSDPALNLFQGELEEKTTYCPKVYPPNANICRIPFVCLGPNRFMQSERRP
jgi:hypothetical protein